MSLTKKHFEILARFCGVHGISGDAIRPLVEMCAELNPHFDEGRFRHRIEETMSLMSPPPIGPGDPGREELMEARYNEEHQRG